MDIEKRVLVHKGVKITEGLIKELARVTTLIQEKDSEQPSKHKESMTVRSALSLGLKVLESKVNPASQKEKEELITKELSQYIKKGNINMPVSVLAEFIVKLQEL